MFSSLRKRRIRWALFALTAVLSALFQHTGLVPELFSVPAMILVPLCVCIGMYERSIPGLMFGALCGALWDFASVQSDGFYTIVLAIAGFSAGVASTFWVRTNLVSCLFLSLGALSFTSGCSWLLFFLLKGYEGAFGVLFSYYIPSVLYSLIFVVAYYYLITCIVNNTKEKKRHSC